MPLWLFAVIFCLALPLVVGAWMIVPLIEGTPMFANGNTTAMLRSLGIYCVWGLGLALFWRGCRRCCARAKAAERRSVIRQHSSRSRRLSKG